MKLHSLFTAAISCAAFVFTPFFTGCSAPDSTSSAEYPVISFACSVSYSDYGCRTAIPQVNLADYKYTLKGAPSGSDKVILFADKTYTELSSMKLTDLSAGIWSFNLYAQLEGKNILSASVNDKFISGNTNIHFILYPETGGTGNVEITLKYASGKGVSYVYALINSTPYVSEGEETSLLDITPGNKYDSVVFSGEGIASGAVKYVHFILYDGNMTRMGSYTDSVYIVSGMTSTDTYTMDTISEFTAPGEAADAYFTCNGTTDSLSWTNPSDSDFAGGIITCADLSYSEVFGKNDSSITFDSTIKESLTNASQDYIFTIRTKDILGNTSSGITATFYHVTALTLDRTFKAMGKSDTAKTNSTDFTVTVEPSNATDKTVTWTLSDTSSSLEYAATQASGTDALTSKNTVTSGINGYEQGTLTVSHGTAVTAATASVYILDSIDGIVDNTTTDSGTAISFKDQGSDSSYYSGPFNYGESKLLGFGYRDTNKDISTYYGSMNIIGRTKSMTDGIWYQEVCRSDGYYFAINNSYPEKGAVSQLNNNGDWTYTAKDKDNENLSFTVMPVFVTYGGIQYVQLIEKVTNSGTEDLTNQKIGAGANTELYTTENGDESYIVANCSGKQLQKAEDYGASLCDGTSYASATCQFRWYLKVPEGSTGSWTEGVTSVTSMCLFSVYSKATTWPSEYIYSDGTENSWTETCDSGISWSWVFDIKSGETKTFSVLLTIVNAGTGANAGTQN